MNVKLSAFEDGLKAGKMQTVDYIKKYANFCLASTALSFYFARCDGTIDAAEQLEIEHDLDSIIKNRDLPEALRNKLAEISLKEDLSFVEVSYYLDGVGIETLMEFSHDIDEIIMADENVTTEEERAKVPYYDSVSKTWRVVTEWGREEGDAIYIASEFVKDSLYYPFHSAPPWKEDHHNHAHEFASVVSFLLKKPDFFSIVGFEEYYSKQEQELLANLKMKLHIPNEETIAAIEEVEVMEKNPSRYKGYTSVEELMKDLQKDDETED